MPGLAGIDWTQIYLLSQLLFELLVTKLVIVSQEVEVDVLVICVVDVEIFLALVGKCWVQLEEVLTAGRDRAEGLREAEEAQHFDYGYCCNYYCIVLNIDGGRGCG